MVLARPMAGMAMLIGAMVITIGALLIIAHPTIMVTVIAGQRTLSIMVEGGLAITADR